MLPVTFIRIRIRWVSRCLWVATLRAYFLGASCGLPASFLLDGLRLMRALAVQLALPLVIDKSFVVNDLRSLSPQKPLLQMSS